MENKNRKHIILLIALVVLTGQIQLFAQAEYTRYQEQVLLKTDRQLCLPGDQVQLHALVLQANTDQPSGLSGFIKIDLIGPYGQEYLQMSRSLQQGELFCDLTVPASLETGYYKLRAYTNWMRNFKSEVFGEVILKVVNPADENLHLYLKDKPLPDSLNTDISAKPRSELSFSLSLPSGLTKAWVKVSEYDQIVDANLVNDSSNLPSNQQINKSRLHLPEIKQQVLEGIIADHTGKFTPGVDICINMLNSNYFDQTRSDSSGYFFFALFGQFDQTDFIICPVYEELNQQKIEIWPFYDPGVSWTAPPLTVTEAELEWLRNQSIYSQISDYYKVEEDMNINSESTSRVTYPFFHPPDKTIILDDYIRLANVREVIYEVVPGVSVRKKNGQDVLNVYTDLGFANSYETLVLLDGIPLIDQQTILELTPDRIEKIEVKNQLYIHGTNLYASIINFISPNNDYAGMELPSNSLVSGIILAPEEDKTRWHYLKSLPRNIPDLSSTLYWAPLDDLSAERITLLTNDRPGWYLIEIYGIGAEGMQYSEQKILQVLE